MSLGKKLVSIIAILSAVITMFVFVSGINNIGELFSGQESPKNINIKQLRQGTPINEIKLRKTDLDESIYGQVIIMTFQGQKKYS